MFFMNLQIVHIILSITGIIHIFYSSNRVEVILNNGFLIEMFFSLMLTTVDRYVAISYPYTYEKLTTKEVLVAITCSWIIPIVFLVLAFTLKATQQHLTIITTVAIAVAAVTLTISNARIYIIAKRHAIAITGTKGKKVLKSTYVCFAIVFSFVFLWLPYLVHNVMVLANRHEPCGKEGVSTFTRGVFQTALVNSLLDPILFVAFRRDMKKALKGTLRIKTKGKTRVELTINTRTVSL